MAERAFTHTPAPWRYDSFDGQVSTERGTVVQPGAITWSPNGPLIAAAPQLLASLLAVEWGGWMHGEGADACSNCGAPLGDSEIFDGLHFVGCELRDSLDAALGVKSPRIERAHG